MPPPTEIPAIEDEGLAELAERCHAGDISACDELYYESSIDSHAESYGDSCGGRIPDTEECVDLLNN